MAWVVLFVMVLCMLAIQDKEGGNMNLDLIKEDVKKHLNEKVEISVFGLRNKNYKVYGYISNIYPSIFTVNENGVEKSFTYSDIATGEINIKYL